MATLSWFQSQQERDWDELKQPDSEQKAALDRKRDIWNKYNEISKENRGGFGEDGKFTYVVVKGGNHSSIIRRVLKGRNHWGESEQP
jgi:hypothetical protein